MKNSNKSSLHDGATTPSGNGVVNTLVLNHYVRICESEGISRQQLLTEIGATEKDLNPDNGWVRQEIIERLLLCRITRWSDPLLGLHMASALEPSVSGVLGYMALCCPTLLDLHNTLHEFGGLVSNLFTTSLVQKPGASLWTIDLAYHDETLIRHSEEWFLGACARLIRRQNPQALRAVHIKHAPYLVEGIPPPEYQRVFCCPVYFHQQRSALLLDPQALNTLSPYADPVVFEMLKQQARLLSAQLGTPGNMAERVRQELRVLLAEGKASRDTLCQRIGISTRHLHRQLQHHHYSYQRILDELRVEFAQKHLVRPDCHLDHLAQELGFSSAKSFSRWFVSKLGVTPWEFRRNSQKMSGPA